MRLIFFSLLVTSLWQLPAQTIAPDTIQPKTKTSSKYLGIQANLLLQQFISFNSNASINTNPFLFSYSKNDLKTGKGFAFGSGFNLSENSSNDGVSSVTVQNYNLAFRLGFEKKYFQDQKLIPFWGIEGAFGGVYTKVVSMLNQSFSGSRTVVETSRLFIGPSFRAGLNYAFSKHILVGTECFFNVQVAYTSTSTNSGMMGQSFVPFNVGFQVPTAIFLIFRY